MQGANSIGFHLVSSGSWPYFHGAILESNPAATLYPDSSRAHQLGDLFASVTTCKSADDINECLYALPVDDIISAQVEAGNLELLVDIKMFMGMTWTPVVDYIELLGQVRYLPHVCRL